VRGVVIWALIALMLDQHPNIGRTLNSAPNDPSIIWHQLTVASAPENPATAKLLAVPQMPQQIFLPYQACALGRFADC
jgi:hypothetical protein